MPKKADPTQEDALKTPKVTRARKTVKKAPKVEEPPKVKRRVGRPSLGSEPSVVFTVRLKSETAKICRKIGGSVLVRNMIEKVVAAEERERAIKSGSPEFLGFDPISMKRQRIAEPEEPVNIKRIDMSAACGFPSPAFDYAADDFNMNEYFLEHPDANYVVTASGDSMVDAGIREGDILVLDRSVEPRSGDIVLAYMDGSLTVKRLRVVGDQVELHPENDQARYPVLRPGKLDDFRIEGVVTGVGRRLRRGR